MFPRSVLVAPAAEFEIADAAGAYEATSPGLGRRFLDDLRAVRAKVEQFPESCALVYPDSRIRRALMHSFPFGVIYQVRPEAIVIITVLPNCSDPATLAVRASARAV